MKMWAAAVSVGSAAGVAVPAGRPHAALAQHLRVVRPCAAAVGYSQPGYRGPSPPLATRVSAFVPVRRALVHGQLLLGSRHHDRTTAICRQRHPVLLLIGFSLVLGLYFGLFGLGVMLVRRATGKRRLALAAAPFLWVALDLAAARITSVPWDQLGLFAGRQRNREPTCALDRRLWHQLSCRRSERAIAAGLESRARAT